MKESYFSMHLCSLTKNTKVLRVNAKAYFLIFFSHVPLVTDFEKFLRGFVSFTCLNVSQESLSS